MIQDYPSHNILESRFRRHNLDHVNELLSKLKPGGQYKPHMDAESNASAFDIFINGSKYTLNLAS